MKQQKNVPRYADGEYLDSLAELFKDLETASKSGVCNVSLLYFRSTETISDYSCGHQNFFDGAILFETKKIWK